MQSGSSKVKRVFYIDPQSYNNLSIYDFQLISSMKGVDVVYFHNKKYQLASFPCREYHAVFSYSDKKGVAKGLSYVFSLMRVALSVLTCRPKVVHIQWFRAFSVDSLFLRFLRSVGVKIVFTAHNVVPHNATKTDVSHYAWYYQHVDAIIVHTERSREELCEQFGVAPEKITVIPHGLLPSNADPRQVATRAEWLREALGTQGKIVFACMGFQNYYKGVDIVSEVWCTHEELRDNDNCMLLVVGKVQNVDLNKLGECKNVVIVDGVVSDVDFDAYLSLASLALLPYRKISQSGVLLTCLQRGVPVVVTDVGGLTDPLRYANVGWNIGATSAENLSRQMLSLVKEPEQIAAVANNHEAFQRIAEVYSSESISAGTVKMYSALS